MGAIQSQVGHHTGTKIAAADFGENLRVKPDISGELVLADAADEEIGYSNIPGVTGEPCSYVFQNVQGTVAVVADGVIAAPAEVFGADNGRVAAAGANKRGIALTSAAAAGDVITMQPQT